MPAFRDMTGESYGRLTAIRYVGKGASNKPMWLFNCSCGNQKEINGADVRAGKIKSCGCIKSEFLVEINQVRRGELPGYHALHDRLRREKGKAKDQLCVDCGSQAFEWSYDNRAEVEHSQLVVSRGKSIVLTYALELEHYEPRCYKCHRKYDGLF